VRKKLWDNDEELFGIVKKELFTCVVGDVMDKMRLQHQFLPPQLRPLHPEMVLIGRAMPVLSVDVFEEKMTGTANKLMATPFGLMLEALDNLRPNEVYVNTGSSPSGTVLNGYVRDTKAILKAGFRRSASGPTGRIQLRVTRWSIFVSPWRLGQFACARAIFSSATSTESA
jgi:regulator of RNase E activity RraA